MHSDKLEQEIARVVQSVNEWDDRTSPVDYPEHLLITSDELADILRNFAPVVVAASPVGPEWQTMETAPKDGSHILLYCEYYGIGRCAWESWRKVWRSDDPNHGIGFPEPTHWMPFPDFPTGSVRAENARRAALAASTAKGDEQQIEAAIDAYREGIYLTDADVHASVSMIVEAANTHHPALNGNRPEKSSPHANFRAEPVAWRVRVKSDDPEEWELLPAGGGADFLNRDGYECQPLYTSVAPEASDAV